MKAENKECGPQKYTALFRAKWDVRDSGIGLLKGGIPKLQIADSGTSTESATRF